MPRDLHRKPFNEGTLVKLELFRAYIVAWLSVFVKSERVTKKKVRIFDLFCGPGADPTGKKGSPILILETLQGMADSIQKVGYHVDVYFNDFDAAKIEELKQTLTDLGLLTGPHQEGFLMKHANPVLRRLKKEGRIDGNITAIEYDSLRRPEMIRVIKK